MIDGNPISVYRLAPDMREVLDAVQRVNPKGWKQIVADANLTHYYDWDYADERETGLTKSDIDSGLRRIRNHVTCNPNELPILRLYACEHCGEADYRKGTHGPGYCSL